MPGRLLTRTEQLLLLAFAASMAIGGTSLYCYRHSSRPEPPAIRSDAAAPAATTISIEAPAPSETKPATELPATEPPPPVAEVAVSVTGAVNAPGLFRLREDARIQDAIKAAGGLSDDADASDLNLAARLIDGSTLTVPARSSSQLEGDRLTARGGATAAQLNPPHYTISGWKSAMPAPPVPPSETAARADTKKTEDAPKAREVPKSGPIDLNTASAEELDSLPGIGPKLAAEIIAYRDHTPFASVDDLTNVNGIGDGRLDAVRGLVTVHTSGTTPPASKSDESAKPKRRSPSKTSP